MMVVAIQHGNKNIDLSQECDNTNESNIIIDLPMVGVCLDSQKANQ